jgi:hypothetical protein
VGVYRLKKATPQAGSIVVVYSTKLEEKEKGI